MYQKGIYFENGQMTNMHFYKGFFCQSNVKLVPKIHFTKSLNIFMVPILP